MRRGLLTLAALLLTVATQSQPVQAEAQGVSRQPTALSDADFVRAAHSSASLQARAAELASSRETRPEVKSFAERMLQFRRRQILRIGTTAAQHRVAVPSALRFEHQVAIENLEPLDFLALSRRYVELSVQVLEQELQLYSEAVNSPTDWIKTLAAEYRPTLIEMADEARNAQKAVGP